MIRIMYRVYRCLERIVLWQGGFQVRMASSEGPETSKREDRRRAQVKDDSESKKGKDRFINLLRHITSFIKLYNYLQLKFVSFSCVQSLKIYGLIISETLKVLYLHR